MSGKHRTKASRSNMIVGSIAASVGVSGVLAAAIVELIAPEPSSAASQPAPQPVTQQGTVVVLTPDSFTARSADGMTQTYAMTPDTNAVTPLAVNDEVTVVGTRSGTDVIATAVAEQSAVGPQGQPMDYGL
jgi:hypothetical protein